MLLFQVQVFASHALACVHAAQGSEVPVACHDGVQGWAADLAALWQKDRLADPCQKCNLELAAAGWLTAVSDSPAGGVGPIPQGSESAPEQHFYTFSPDRLFRPPIAVSC